MYGLIEYRTSIFQRQLLKPVPLEIERSSEARIENRIRRVNRHSMFFGMIGLSCSLRILNAGLIPAGNNDAPSN